MRPERRPAYRLYQLLWSGLDLIYPPRCGGCEESGQRWCDICAASVRLINAPICPLCGNPQLRSAICRRCQSDRPAYRAARSWARFEGPLKNALHRLKYGRDIGLGASLARPLIRMTIEMDWQPDLVVPVPLGKARLAERGYNQVALLARPLAYALGTSYRPGALRRKRDTRSQVGLRREERWANVQDAFLGQTQYVRAQSILLVDDVMTSGATLDAGANALLAAGARTVHAITLARALRDLSAGATEQTY